jgi:hypothetical protein
MLVVEQPQLPRFVRRERRGAAEGPAAGPMQLKRPSARRQADRLPMARIASRHASVRATLAATELDRAT